MFMVSIYYEVKGAPGVVYLKRTDPKPIEGVLNGTSMFFVDDVSAGMMLFDAEERCWWDKEGNKWV